jgi:hypothetical protein
MKIKLRAFLLTSLITSSLIGSNIFSTIVHAETIQNQSSISNIGYNIYNSTVQAQSQKAKTILHNILVDRTIQRNNNIQNYINFYLTKYDLNLDEQNNIENFKNYYTLDTSFAENQKNDISYFVEYITENIAPPEFKAKNLNSYFRLYCNLDTLKSWGIKGYVHSWFSNNRDYEWYIDQMNTGSYSNNNCGPAVATMAVDWANKDLHNTADEARKRYPVNGGWWTTDNVQNYLNDYSTPYNIDFILGVKEEIKDVIDKGEIGILCINATYLNYGSYSEREGLYYSPSYGHFVLVKGYIETDNTFYVEIYDPYSNNSKNADGSLKGKDRYYDIKYLENAIRNRWNYIIRVRPIAK